MTDKFQDFNPNTPITASWLNGVDSFVNGASGIGGPLGSSLVGFIQAGVGAVARTVQDKLREHGSVFDFMTDAEKADVLSGAPLLDHTAACQKAIAACKNLSWGDSGHTYRITSKLLFNVFGQRNHGGGVLLFAGDTTTRLADVLADNVTFEGITFNGNDSQPNGPLVYVASNVIRPRFQSCTFTNITGRSSGTNILNQTYALVISPYGVTDFEVTNCLFKDLFKYNNGAYFAVASGIGFIGGIAFLLDTLSDPTAAQPVVTRGRVSGCVFDTIRTILAPGLSDNDVTIYDDGDAIRTYGYSGGAERLEVHVVDCDFIKVSKRAFKFRASGSIAENCRVYAALGPYGMSCAIDTGNGNTFRKIDIYASFTTPLINTIQVIPSGEATNSGTLVDGLYVSHSKGGFVYFALNTTDTLENITLRNAVFANVIDRAIEQATPFPATQRNIRFENIVIRGANERARAFACENAADASSGIIVRNVEVTNADCDFTGVGADIDDLKITINSTSYLGFSNTAQLFGVGASGYDGLSSVRNVTIDATGASNTFSNATRGPLVYLIGNRLQVRNFVMKVADAQDTTYPHIDIFGAKGVDIDGLTYEGTGFITVGTTVASPYSCVRNATRNGEGACDKPFLYTNNAGTTDTLFENIVDFRPTTNYSITINSGARFIVNNVSSRTSNATIVQHGGLAKTANINTF